MDSFIGRFMPDDCLWLGLPWLNFRFSLALTVCDPKAIFLLSSWNVNLIQLFHCGDALHK